MKARCLVVLIALLGGCTDLANPVDVTVDSLPATVQLRPGQSVDLPGDRRITFQRVTQDSRCPTGAVCFWAGDAAVWLSLKVDTTLARDCTLHTTLDSRVTDFGGMRIDLTRVDPYPELNKEISPWQYLVTLDIDWLNR